MPRSSNKQASKKKTTNSPSSKRVLKKKYNASAIKTTGHNNLAGTMSRKQLINSLAEMGILTPSVINMDMLRRLYTTNITADRNKPTDVITKAPTRFEDDGDETDDIHDEVIEGETTMGVSDVQGDSSDEEAQGDYFKSTQLPKKFKNKSGKTFTLFSAPVAEEHLTLKNGGLVGRGDSDIEAVPKGLRKAIIEGYNVNLVRILLPRDNKKYSRDDDEDEDKNIYLKPKADPRLDKV